MCHMFSIKMHPLTEIWTGAFQNILDILQHSLVKPEEMMNVFSEYFFRFVNPIKKKKKKKKKHLYKPLSNGWGKKTTTQKSPTIYYNCSSFQAAD